MPRFVILEHDWPELHWDLMLEVGAALKTWRLARRPEPSDADGIPAIPIGDHRLAYLDYEGPVSGDRGAVSRWDGGSYLLTYQDEERWEWEWEGRRVKGRAVLQRDASVAWELRFTAE